MRKNLFILYIYILENVLTIIGKRWNKIFSLFLKFDLPLSQVESSSAPILPIRFFVHPIYIYIFYHSFNPCPISTRVCARIHTLARVKRVRARRRAVHHVCIQDRGGSCETAVRAFLPAPSSVRRTGAPVAWRIHGRKKKEEGKKKEKKDRKVGERLTRVSVNVVSWRGDIGNDRGQHVQFVRRPKRGPKKIISAPFRR